MPMGKPRPPAADYYIVICRAIEFPDTGIWPLSVRDALPNIQVPLKAEDEAVALPLRKCLDRVYAEGRYGEEIDYSKPPIPPLSRLDAVWARKLLAEKRSLS